MLPTNNYDSFQQQLNDLQRSYNQLGKTAPYPMNAPRKLHRVSGIDKAKAKAEAELNPGDEAAYFDENRDVFYAVGKREDGSLAPLLVCPFTIEQEPPPPEYATKQDLELIMKKLDEIATQQKEAKA